MSPEKDYGKLDFTKTCLICTAQVYWKTTGINCSEYQQLESINNMLKYHLFSQSDGGVWTEHDNPNPISMVTERYNPRLWLVPLE